jgi:enterochelin esterase family protein
MRHVAIFATLVIALALTAAPSARAQDRGGSRPPEFVSPEISSENKVTFRIHAPKAEVVKLSSSDMPGTQRGVDMKKADNGVWEATVGPVAPGAYRYNLNVDGLAVIDPRNPTTSESNTNTWSLVYVPGSDISDIKNVPHGAIAQVTYYSDTLKRFRRLHVYTPPGYEKGEGKYPVFYLLHGASDSDASWSSVGRAGFILDNLIAEGKARPMIVAMPAGHTSPFRFGPPGDRSFNRQIDEFGDDFVKDLRPYVEKNYRVLGDRAHRAIAGLSMGGAQTLNIAFNHLDEYGYVGVFSSGIFGITGGPGGGAPNTQWEEQHKATLDNAELKTGLGLLWFAIGKDDFLLQTSNATVGMLKNHKFDVVSKETAGGHTWINWRDYLHEFAPLLFSEK